MTTQYTPILKLALPVTGELSGTWGDVVNDNITSMVEQAVAGLATINTWTANSHTLSTANGTTSESRCAMLVAQDGAGLSAAGEIVCPAASKLYVLKNASSYTITLKTAAGTGVAVVSGNTAFLFCDGTNVNACVTTIVDGRVTGNLTVDGNATVNGNTTLGNATSDTITATARFASDLVPSTDNARDLGSSANSWRDLYIDGTAFVGTLDLTNLEVTNIKAKDGTAAASIADATGVVSFVSNPVLSGGTANGVLYLNGSKAATSGSALTFDGTTFTVSSKTSIRSDSPFLTGANLTSGGNPLAIGGEAGNTLVGFFVNNNEQMRLTSTGLGIGTSSPSTKLHVVGVSTLAGDVYFGAPSATNSIGYFFNASSANRGQITYDGSGGTFRIESTYGGSGSYSPLTLWTGGSERMRIDTSGNLGIGTTAPQSKLEVRQDQSGAITRVIANNNSATTGSGSSFDYYFGTTRLGGLTHAFSTSAYLAFDVWNGSAATERMRITSAGDVGIGTSSPGAKLQVGDGASVVQSWVSGSNSGTGGGAFTAVRNGSSYVAALGNASAILGGAYSSSPVLYFNGGLQFSEVGTERMRITSGGDVGIGTSTPVARLDVVGAASDGGMQFRTNTTSVGIGRISGNPAIYWGSTTPLVFSSGGVDFMRLDSSGNLGLGVTPSAWANARAYQVGAYAAYAQRTAGTSDLVASWNATVTSGNSSGTGYVYRVTGDLASAYEQNGAHRWYTAPSGTAGNAITFTQAMTLDVSGNLGIGTSSPGAKFDVVGDGRLSLSANQTRTLAWFNTTNSTTYGRIKYIDTSGVFDIGNSAAYPVTFSTSDTERMRITSAGDVGIGTSTPAARLDVVGAASDGGMQFRTNTTTVGIGRISGNPAIYWGSTTPLVFSSGGVDFMRLDASGNLGLGVTPSAWAGFSAFQLQRGSVAANSTELDVSHNAYFDGAWKYIANGFATNHYQASGAYIWRTAPSGTAGNAITFTQAMTLDASGQLGVGITGPAQKLHVDNGANATFIRASSTQNSSGFDFGVGGSGDSTAYVYNRNNTPLVFGTNATEKMRITSAGDVGIGTSSPGAKLQVGDGASVVQSWVSGSNSGTGGGAFTAVRNGSSYVAALGNASAILGGAYSSSPVLYFNGGLQFSEVGTERMRLDANGNLGVGTTDMYGRINVQRYTGSQYSTISLGDFATPSNSVGIYGRVTNSGVFGISTAGAPVAFFIGGPGTTEAMRLDTAGNLGIGTSSPSAKLHVSGTGDQEVRISTFTSGNPKLALRAEGVNGGAITYDRATSLLQLENGGTTAVYLNTSGDVGIGTGSPSAKLEVQNGYIISGSAGSTSGAKILGGRYSGNEHITTFGSEYANGGPVLGYGVWPSTTASGAFISSSSVTLSRGAYAIVGNEHVWSSGAVQTLALNAAVTMSERMKLDANGNLGLGVTPNAWGSTAKAVEIAGGSLVSFGSAALELWANAYYDGTNSRYKTSAFATQYIQNSSTGQHRWFTAPSGTAGNAISFTQAMTLDSSGNLAIGQTSSALQSGGTGITLYGSSNSELKFLNSTTGQTASDGTALLVTTLDFQINNREAGAITFGTSNIERMRLDSSGNLGIGTSSPGFKLDVQGASGVGIQIYETSTGNNNRLQITQSGAVSTYNNTYSTGNGSHAWQVGNVESMRLDSSGNLGLGVTPASWQGTSKAIQMGSYSAFFQDASGYPGLSFNAVQDPTLGWKYTVTDVATRYSQTNGAHQWFTAPSGTAGNTISFTQAMTLDASGQLGIGTTSPGVKLDVSDTTAVIRATSSTGTNICFGSYNNTGGALRVGLESSTGGSLLSGASSYSGVIGTTGAYPLAFGTNATERMRLDASGNLGLGVTPSAWGSGYIAVDIGSRASLYSYLGITYLTNNIYFNGTSNIHKASAAASAYVQVDGAHSWSTAPSAAAGATVGLNDRMRIDVNGNILVGSSNTSVTTGSGFKVLPAANGTNNPQVAVVTSASTNTTSSLSIYSTGAAAYRFYVVDDGTIYATNTTISAISDQRLKENVQDLDVGLNAIMALKPRKFDWKPGKGKNIKGDRGFIAQEFEQVFPDLIDEWKDPAPEGEAAYKSVRQDLIPVLTKAIQEQQAIIEELRARVAKLETQP